MGSANTFNITDFEVLASVESSLVGSSLVGGEFIVNQGQTGFVWDGSQITQVFRGNVTNGANFFTDDFLFRYSFNPNFSLFVDQRDSGPSIVEFGFGPTTSAPTTPGPNPQPAPEPATIFGLLTFSAVALGSRYQRSK